MVRVFVALLLFARGCGSAPAKASAAIDWAPLATAIDAFDDVPNVHTIVGNGSGILFTHSKGSTNGRTSMAVASATKWVGGVLVRTTTSTENPSSHRTLEVSCKDALSSCRWRGCSELSDDLDGVVVPALLDFISLLLLHRTIHATMNVKSNYRLSFSSPHPLPANPPWFPH